MRFSFLAILAIVGLAVAGDIPDGFGKAVAINGNTGVWSAATANLRVKQLRVHKAGKLLLVLESGDSLRINVPDDAILPLKVAYVVKDSCTADSLTGCGEARRFW